MAGWTKETYESKEIHSHWNMDVLNKLSEGAKDNPLYDNKAICACDSNAPGLAYAQTTLTGVIASAASPKVVNIKMAKTSDFCTVPTWVEYLVPGETQVETKYSFDNEDAAAFNAAKDTQVVFDGTMHLKTKYEYPFAIVGPLAGTGQYSESVWVDTAAWKTIEKVEVV